MEAKDTIMNLREQAEVWLKVEQKAGFLRKYNLEGALADSNLIGEGEQLHSQAIAEAQAKITWKARDPEVAEAYKAGQEAERKVWREACEKSGIPLDVIW